MRFALDSAALLGLALILDAALGEPRALWQRLPHPAVVMGRAVGALEHRLNRGAGRRARGTLALAILVVAAGLAGQALHVLPDGGALEILAVAVLVAQRSLADHVGAVADALRLSLGDGRLMVARIVGRDTADMNEPQVARAAIESAAENFSDGVVAPVFWYLLAGLPGIVVYKIVNTADSMIGHRTPRFEQFGWAAARFDDVMNWVPARLSAALIALAHGRGDLWPLVVRDAPLHRSPNAGWPEAAMAGVLGVALSGPRSYHGQRKDYPFVNAEGRHAIGAEAVDAACAALWRSWAVLLALCAVLFLV
ncbi:MAG: adenosylcobinamide-phosphate synthase CbiB [Paracoccaceae bacterium]